MKSNQFNNYIKNKVDETPIEPSHDAWNRIQARMTSTEEIQQPKTKWKFSAAAAVLVLAGLSGFFFMRNNPSTTESVIVKTEETNSPKTKDSVAPLHNDEVELVQDQESTTRSNAVLPNEEVKLKEEAKKVVEEGKVLPKIEASPKSLSQQELKSSLATTLDTVQVHKKKKNYVDSEDLLYSIESKDNIKKTKEGGRVAVIDLNKK